MTPDADPTPNPSTGEFSPSDRHTVPQGRIRRAHALIGYWETGGFQLRNYMTDRRTRIDPIVLHVLDGFSEYTPPEDARRRLGHLPGAENLLMQFVQRDILLEEGSSLDERDRRLQDAWRWGHEARFFHFSTRDVPYEEDRAAQRESLLRLKREETPLGPFQDLEGKRVSLGGDFSGLEETLGDVLLRRRTLRSFSRQRLSLELFGRITRWIWGYTHLNESGEIGPYLLKTSPSGGARHSIEVYPIVIRVEGLKPGVYHYAVRENALVAVGGDLIEDELRSIFGGQPWLAQAAVIYVMVARIARSDWKYRHGHAYRVLLLDAGQLGQTFHHVCTAVDLAPFTLAGFKDTRLEEALGIDGVGEIPLYAAACGYPADATSDGNPSG